MTRSPRSSPGTTLETIGTVGVIIAGSTVVWLLATAVPLYLEAPEPQVTHGPGGAVLILFVCLVALAVVVAAGLASLLLIDAGRRRNRPPPPPASTVRPEPPSTEAIG